MKILYAFNGTGYGHASRVMSILPLLQHHEVDLMVSGEMNPIDVGYEIKYRFKGFTFNYSNGRVNYWKTFKQLNLIQFIKDVFSLSVTQYNLVISDFEPISAYAAKLRGVKSLSLSHQASFLSEDTPRPSKIDKVAEWVLKNYAPCEYNIGFHFKRYDKSILPPHIRKEIRDSKEHIKKQNYILVYLPSYKTDDLVKIFYGYSSEYKFIIMSSETDTILSLQPNIKIRPINSEDFIRLLRSCSGVITGGGFETVAEALYLNKQVLTIPIKGQYEQECNATAADKFPSGIKGTLSHIYLKWFLLSTTRDIIDNNFKISTDEEVLQAIEHVLYDQV
jgi:uncharacterized protein (TIGR00661 family)